MANEGSCSIQISVNKGGFSDSRNKSYNFDVSGTHPSIGVQAIGTTHEVIAVNADCATLGECFISNLDGTNFLQLGLVVSATFYPFCKLKPGATAKLPLGMATNALYAKADTAACDLEFRIYEA